MAEAKKVHGRAAVGLVTNPANNRPIDASRTIARLGRVRDALTRATGERKASLEAEEKLLVADVEKIRDQASAVLK